MAHAEWSASSWAAILASAEPVLGAQMMPHELPLKTVQWLPAAQQQSWVESGEKQHEPPAAAQAAPPSTQVSSGFLISAAKDSTPVAMHRRMRGRIAIVARFACSWQDLQVGACANLATSTA